MSGCHISYHNTVVVLTKKEKRERMLIVATYTHTAPTLVPISLILDMLVIIQDKVRCHDIAIGYCRNIEKT